MSHYYDAACQLTKKAYESIKWTWVENTYVVPTKEKDYGDSIVLQWTSKNNFPLSATYKEIIHLPDEEDFAYKLVLLDESGGQEIISNEYGENLYEDLYAESLIYIPGEYKLPKLYDLAVSSINYFFLREVFGKVADNCVVREELGLFFSELACMIRNNDPSLVPIKEIIAKELKEGAYLATPDKKTLACMIKDFFESQYELADADIETICNFYAQIEQEIVNADV